MSETNINNEEISMYEVVEKWTSVKNTRRDNFKGLETFVEALGYEGDFCSTPSQNFFNDNPGAIEAIYNWVIEQEIPEWRNNLLSEVPDDDDEDFEDDEDDDDDTCSGYDKNTKES